MTIQPVYKDTYRSPIGTLLVEASDIGISRIDFVDESDLSKETRIPNKFTLMTLDWLDVYFHGDQTQLFQIITDIKGTPYQQKVWAIIQTIPLGDMITYQHISNMIPGSSPRPVGSATGANPLALYIPCHRVIGKGTLLRGYAGGIKRKEWLLAFERKDSLFLPDV